MSQEAKLKEVFADSLGIEVKTTDWGTLAYRGIEEWDSIAHMALIGALEDEFGIMIDTDDVIDMSSFDEAKRILDKYGVTFS